MNLDTQIDQLRELYSDDELAAVLDAMVLVAIGGLTARDMLRAIDREQKLKGANRHGGRHSKIEAALWEIEHYHILSETRRLILDGYRRMWSRATWYRFKTEAKRRGLTVE